MRRALSLLVALALLSAAMALPARATTTLACAHPQTLNGTEGTLSYPPYLVQQDQWTGEGAQTMHVCSASSWTAVATQSGAPSTGVKTFPDSDRPYTDWEHCSSQPRLDSFTKLRASFAMSTPNAGSWDTALDLFFNGGVCNLPTTELMVLPSWRAVDFPASTRVTVGGVDYWLATGTRFIQFRRVVQVSSDTVNLRALFRFCEARGLLAPADTLQFVQGGVEVLTTHGTPLSFTLTRFSVS